MKYLLNKLDNHGELVVRTTNKDTFIIKKDGKYLFREIEGKTLKKPTIVNRKQALVLFEGLLANDRFDQVEYEPMYSYSVWSVPF